jgi:hypothetical protein
MGFLSGRLKTLGIGIGCGVLALASSFAFAPALAGRTSPDAHADKCDSSHACLDAKNSGTGSGLRGFSAGYDGVVGQTSFSSKSTGAAGVAGVDFATGTINNSGVNGRSNAGFGVFGETSTGIGVRALADTGTGILADANGGDGIFATTQSNVSGESSAGVFGEDVGNSSLASGVTGFSGTGIGVQADQFERGKYLNAAFLGLTFSSEITTYFPAEPPGGLFNSDIGEGVVAETNASQSEALAAANFGGGPVMRGYQNHTEVMEVDNSGNMILAGKLTQNGNPGAIAHTSGAGDVVMYAPTQAVATVEDVGEAHLRAGQTYVSLDPRFAATMNRAHAYMVFVTPQGDTPGLYVAQKTATGFAVREHGGSSDVAFDYRIVAEPYGAVSQRLPSAPHLAAHGFTRSFTRHTSDLLQKRGVILQR